ncbi:MAG TPA: xanthine dehydrogenase family protein molybdopterin-binding subunit [Rhizomicrobium sp.]|jgi:carbon-monoxide dehydrogenase large subunit|nr:xanthine dehydrogenase family protein molybdopterin-binding subunit [Rhizomicrobium sp.]
MKFGVGQAVRRTEDIRFLTGRGRYTDDLRFPRETFACFVRSPHAHARIVGIDIGAAIAAPGVIGVLTHDDVEAFGAKPMPCLAPLASRDGSHPKASPKPLLARDKVTFAGEAIAMIVAETYAQAKDAAELVNVDYEPLDAAGTLDAALSGPQIWESAPDNVVFDWAAGNAQACDEAFAAAAHTISLETVQNRVCANPMETRNAIGLYDGERDQFTLHTGTQGAGGARERVSHVLNLPPQKLRVTTPDVGGGFGMKGFIYPEQPLVLIAAKKLTRPVRWSAERVESFLADDHGRDMRLKGELALDGDGKILALRITGEANMGGYLSQYAPFIATLAGGRIFGGLYRIPNLCAAVKGYFSNSAPVDAYRGAGRPEAAYLIERLMDAAAFKTGLDRVEIRRRNLFAPDELPAKNWFGMEFDSGNFPYMLEEAARLADVKGFAARREKSLAEGKRRGLGLAYYVEITAATGGEPARLRFGDHGEVEAYVATQSTGQGHETAFAQVVAARLGVPFESVVVKQGDTDWVNGFGTGGSRSLNMAGGALEVASDEVIRKGKEAAAHVLQAGGAAVEFRISQGAGAFHVQGSERAIAVPELAMTLKRETIAGFEAGLDSDGHYHGAASTFPNGCHICEVEIDSDTGEAGVVSYHVLDDFGRVINPMLVKGQVHGGVAQGLGQALMENCVYDPASGQILTASFTDYAMPRAADMPDIHFEYREFPCKTHPLGAKGCGEAGTVGALPAVMSAVADALGVVHLDMPATPERLWRAMHRKV